MSNVENKLSEKFVNWISVAHPDVRGYFREGFVDESSQTFSCAFKPKTKNRLDGVLARCQRFGLSGEISTSQVSFTDDYGENKKDVKIVVLKVQIAALYDNGECRCFDQVRKESESEICHFVVRHPEQIINEERVKKAVYKQVEDNGWLPIELQPLRNSIDRALTKLREFNLDQPSDLFDSNENPFFPRGIFDC